MSEPDLPAASDDLDSAATIFYSGDETGAFHRFETLAKQGSVAAMTWLGFMYQKGRGVAVDESTALSWYSKAAEKGNADAMCRIGYMYFSGCGLAVDLAAARDWYRKSAEAGDANGQNSLASMLEAAGEHAEMERWLRKAADQGHNGAIKSLGERSAYQLCEEKRYGEALPILEKAANGGSAWAEECLGNIYWNGRGVACDLGLAMKYFQAAYDGGRRSVANDIGRLHYQLGRPELALEWLRKATDQPISSLYRQHEVLRTNPSLESYLGESDELLKKAAESGHVFAKRDMALRMMKSGQALRLRLLGLQKWLAVFPYAIRLVMKNESDERLH